MLKYAKKWFDLNGFQTEIIKDSLFLDLDGFQIEMSTDEIKYRAELYLDSEIQRLTDEL